jgi:hypothetical protein
MTHPAAGLAHDVWLAARKLDASGALELYERWDIKRGGGHGFRRELARRDLFYLLRCLLNRGDMCHPWLYARVREVEVARDGYLDLWAREHRKSSIITFGCTIQDILASHGDDPLPEWGGIEPTFGILSHTATNAIKFLQQIRAEMENNDQLIGLFPDILWANPHKDAPRWSDAGIIVRRKSNPRECTVEAWGLDNQPTGSHFFVLDYDDIISREAVNSPDMIQKATENWELSVNLGVEGGRTRYIGTRYAIMDTYAEIINRGIVGTRIYPSTNDGTATGKPVLFSPEEHELRRRSMGAATFSAQWLQKPVSKGTATFDIAHLRFAEIRPKTINIFILGDPANSKKRDSDRTGFVVLAYDAQRNFYLVDGFNHKMNLKERWDALSGLHIKWSRAEGVQSVRVGYERYGVQADIEHFQSQMELAGRTFEIEEVSWVQGGRVAQAKDDRIGRLQPDFQNGKFHLPYLCRHEDELCFLRVEAGEIKYVKAVNETKLMRQMKQAGQLYRVLRPITRKDEGRTYDLATRFIEEYLNHPAAGAFKDLLDATSRVYDLEPKPPVVIDSKDLEPEAYSDS